MATTFQEWLGPCLGNNVSRSHQTLQIGLSDDRLVSVQFKSSRRRDLEDFVQPIVGFRFVFSVDQDVVHVREQFSA